MGYFRGWMTKKDAKWVFWVPVLLDLLLVACEVGLLFGERSTIKSDFRDHCRDKYVDGDTQCVDQSGCDDDDWCQQWSGKHGYGALSACDSNDGCYYKCDCHESKRVQSILISLVVFLSVNFLLYFIKVICAIYGGRSDICGCDDPADLSNSCFMNITDNSFLLLLILRPGKLKALMLFHTTGRMPLILSPMKFFDLIIRWIPLATLCAMIAFEYGVVFKYKWITVWCFTLLLYIFALAKRKQFNYQITREPPPPKPKAPKRDAVGQAAARLPDDGVDQTSGKQPLYVDFTQPKRGSVLVSGLPTMPMSAPMQAPMQAPTQYSQPTQVTKPPPEVYYPPTGAQPVVVQKPHSPEPGAADFYPPPDVVTTESSPPVAYRYGSEGLTVEGETTGTRTREGHRKSATRDMDF